METSVIICADRAQGNAQHQAPAESTAQRKASGQCKQGKAEPIEPTSPPTADEVEMWAVALSEEATSATDKQDLQRRIFNFLTLCKQHIEAKQVCAFMDCSCCRCAFVHHTRLNYLISLF